MVDQAIKEKLPLVTSLLVNVKRGCLATYAADYPALGKQAAALADKIFKGSKPVRTAHRVTIQAKPSAEPTNRKKPSI